MGNLILATPILSDAATITAGTETAAGPVTNLQKMQPTDLWEAATTAAYCEIDLGAVTAFNLVALLATNAVAVADSHRSVGCIFCRLVTGPAAVSVPAVIDAASDRIGVASNRFPMA